MRIFTLSDFVPCQMQKLEVLTVARDKNVASLKSDSDTVSRCKHDSGTMHCI